MSGLLSALDELEGEDLSRVPDATLEPDFAELQRAAERLEAERLRRLHALDQRHVHLRDGFVSMATWHARRHRVSSSEAVRELGTARALEAMPEARRAFQDGEVSLSGVRVLAAARATDPDQFAGSEALLVDAARRHSVADLQRVVSHWSAAVRSHCLEGRADPDWQRRYLHLSPTVFGMVRIDGDLDPETGEAVLTAVRSFVDADVRSDGAGDSRTPGQRRADALGEICRRWLDLPDRPILGGERPHVTITVDVQTLRDGSGAGCALDHAGPVMPKVARLLACDASVRRIVTEGRSEPLDVGRRTPVVPAGLRRAVIIRDRGCRFPGCDRPHSWCDAHHVVHWADGGPTALTNLLLLCRRHHRMIHTRGGFQLAMNGGRPVFHRPDGSLLDERAPPVHRVA